MHLFRLILAIWLFVVFASCKGGADTPTVAEEQETYFSIKQFLDDQWKNREGVPYTLLRVASFNGVSDSAFVPLDSTLWHSLRSRFDETDISDPRFFGRYTFNTFEEEALDLINLYYEAIDPELFTRKLNIGIDYFTGRVRSVYVETSKKNAVYEKKGKLLYVPDRLIQVQEYEKSVVSPRKQLNVAYYFEY